MAYNINSIGNLLTIVREKELEEEKKIKLVRKLCKKNLIEKNLEFKLLNHAK